MLSGASMAFDPIHRRFLLFGGETIRANGGGDATITEVQGKTYVSDLLAGQTWTELTLDPSPGARAGALTIYDAKRDRFIVAGGRDAKGRWFDVWAFEFEPQPHWTLLGDGVDLPAGVYDNVPTVPIGDAIAPTTPALYDSLGDRMIAFAEGKMFSMPLEGPPATQRLATTGMPFLQGASIAGDFANRRIYAVQNLAFPPDSLLGVVWELQLDNHNTWVRHNGVGPHPGRRLECAVAFDAAGNRLVVAGGYYGNYFTTDTKPSGWPRVLYSFPLDGSDTWTMVTPAGAPPLCVRQSATSWDPVTRSLLIYGGYGWRDAYVSPYNRTDAGGIQQSELYGLTIDGVPAWSAWSPPGIMEARSGAASAVDVPGRRWFVYGGSSLYGGAQSDLFEVDLDRPGGWRRMTSGVPALSDPAMTFTGTHLLAVGGDPLQTWTMDVTGSSRVWARIAESGTQPPRSTLLVLLYDPLRARVLMFRGSTAWTLSPGDVNPEWSSLAIDAATPGPGGPVFAAVWDSAGDRAILPDSSYVLEFGTSPPSWVKLAVTGAPLQAFTREYCAAWDARRHRVLTFGGVMGSPGHSVNRLAQLDPDSGVWSDVSADGTESPPRASGVSAFDTRLDRWLIASGWDDYSSPLNSRIQPDNQVYALWMDSSTPTRISFAGASSLADGLRLRWSGDETSGALRVWRRTATEESTVLGDAQRISPGLFEYIDRTRQAGVRYAYRLERSDGTMTDESWIDADRLAFAFTGVRPNPAEGAWTIAWTQPRAGDVRLTVTDVAGRRVLARTFTGAAGAHVEPLPASASLAPGLYFLELRTGESVAVRRAARLGR